MSERAKQEVKSWRPYGCESGVVVGTVRDLVTIEMYPEKQEYHITSELYRLLGRNEKSR